MKRLIFLSFVFAHGAFAQSKAVDPFAPNSEKNPRPPSQVQVTVEFIEVSQVEENRLIYAEKLGRNGDKLRAELQHLIDAGKGTMINSILVSAKSGQKATAESIREVIYPTEWSPVSCLPPQDGDPPAVKPNPLETFLSIAVPTAFTTRNTGSTLEVEPTLSEDARIIDLRFVPELVFDTGSRVYHRSKDALGNETVVEEPLFYSFRTNTGLTLADGRSQLAAVLSPKGADGALDPTTKALVIVRADVVTIDPSEK